MEGFWMWVLMILAVQASALPLLSSARPFRYSSLIPDGGSRMTKLALLRNLQLQGGSSDHLDLIQSNIKKDDDDPRLIWEDYQPTDPSPASGTSKVKSSPIEHGALYNPNIPKPPPSDHPDHEPSPSPSN